MAGVNVTEGSGVRVAMDKVGTATVPATDDRIQYVKLDGGGAGLSVPIENATAANLAAQVSTKALLTTHPGQWVATHCPAANTQATCSKAAGAAGVRHVCTGVSFTVVAGTSAPTAAVTQVDLRDGATGAGTILASWKVGVPAVAGTLVTFSSPPLNIPGTAATAMTLEFAAALGANTFESVVLTGYTTPAA